MAATAENSYRNIIKRLSAFGGVQIFNVLVSIVRGKFVAVFLGPEGMGIAALYSAATSTIQQFSALGIGNAIVKETSASKDDPTARHLILKVSRRLIWVTALLGALICTIGAPLWSRISFGDSTHTFSFVCLGASVALTLAGVGYMNMLQGLGEVKRLSKASVVGGLSGLIFGVPLYWLYGYDGIVPAMILLAATTFAFYYINYRRSHPPTETVYPLGNDDIKAAYRRILLLGLVLLASTLAGTLTNNLITIYVRYAGDTTDVGLFQSASSITNQFIGMVFSALALDYFPRLSAVGNDKRQLSEVVSRQMEIVMLTVIPLIMLLIIATPLAIRILLTDKFLSTIVLVRWLGYGSMLMAVSYPLGYIFVARGDRRIYLWVECLACNLVWLGCSIGGYMVWGLNGLGVSLALRSMIDIIVYATVCRRRYELSIDKGAIKEISVGWTMCTCCFLMSFCTGAWVYPSMIALCAIVSAKSFFGLRRRFRSSV